ncbi:uncharacterized protein LOC106663978 [Cimex lectularius]|uniref:Uncharacterized protein n=1 Tax=Cimex lectularius TaxID=79782 RepID=A0A8I6RIY5_CIMLE|nr:uncharacterized protein LOC106663978 [Cimex lectularius]
MSANNVLENKICAQTEKSSVQESVNGGITNSPVTVRIKYGNKSLEKDKEENEEFKNDDFHQHITYGQPINCIPTVTFDSINSSSDLKHLSTLPPINSGLVVDPDQILNSCNTIVDEHCINSGLTSDPDHLFNFQQDDGNLTINPGLITDQDKINKNSKSEEILKQNEETSNPTDKFLLIELSELAESSAPAEDIIGEKSNDQIKLDNNGEFIHQESFDRDSAGLDNVEAFNCNQNLCREQPDSNQEIESVKDADTQICAPAKYDYLSMINQEVCSLVNSITEENYRSSDDDEVIDDINSESSTVDNLESTFKKPIILEENDAQCIFGWTLLSPGLMEIKISPDSDDSNDVIRIRRTASLQCRIESGDINKLNAFRENNEKAENTNDFGEMEYVDFLEYLSQVTNRSANEMQENDDQINLVFQTEDDKDTGELFNSKKRVMQNIQQMLSTHSQNNTLMENSVQLPSEKKGECGVDVIEGPQEMSFPTEEDNVMSVKFLMPSDSAELQPKTREDGEAASISKSPDLIELEEANQNLAKEKSLISIRHQQSLEQQHEPVEQSRNKKNGIKKKNTLYRWLKSKKDIPSTNGNPSNTPNEVKKKKSWFRFWF